MKSMAIPSPTINSTAESDRPTTTVDNAPEIIRICINSIMPLRSQHTVSTLCLGYCTQIYCSSNQHACKCEKLQSSQRLYSIIHKVACRVTKTVTTTAESLKPSGSQLARSVILWDNSCIYWLFILFKIG